MATQRWFALSAEVKSVSEAAQLERAVVDEAEDPVQTRDYWQSISTHYAKLGDLHHELAVATDEMRTILDRYCD